MLGRFSPWRLYSRALLNLARHPVLVAVVCWAVCVAAILWGAAQIEAARPGWADQIRQEQRAAQSRQEGKR